MLRKTQIPWPSSIFNSFCRESPSRWLGSQPVKWSVRFLWLSVRLDTQHTGLRSESKLPKVRDFAFRCLPLKQIQAAGVVVG